MIWRWKAVDEKGKRLNGFVEEASLIQVLASLRARNLFPTEIEPIHFGFIWAQLRMGNLKIYWARIARELYTFLSAGIPLLSAIEMIRDKEKSPYRKNQWQRCYQRVRAGEELSISFQEFTPEMIPFMITLVKVGEKTGTLGESLLAIAEQLEEEYFFDQKVKGTLFYPTLLLSVAISVLYIISVAVLPMYKDLFTSLDAQLPFVTHLLFSFGSFVPVVALSLGMALLLRFFKNKDSFWSSLPGSGKIKETQTLMVFCSLLSKLVNAGLPLLDAFSLLEGLSKEKRQKRFLGQLISAVREGRRLSSVVSNHPYFPSDSAKMISVAEESGRLSEMLTYLTLKFKRELEDHLQRYNRTLEPLLILGMAGVVAFVAFGVLYPLFDLSTKIR